MKIFVGNLSLLLTEDDLEHIFETFGKVDSVSIVTDNLSGLPSGFVEMPDETEALTAIRALDGTEVIGYTISLRARDEKSNRRDADERRFENRRNPIERRMSLDRRLYIDKIEFDDRREDTDRRVNPQRRSDINRRSTSNRRAENDRRL